METCIQAEQLNALLHEPENLILIDVRTPSEFEERHLPYAINIPLDKLPDEMPYFETQTHYISICGKGGGRSEKAADLLRSAGFDARFLCGGTNAWFGLHHTESIP